jgi:hypothetical protein
MGLVGCGRRKDYDAPCKEIIIMPAVIRTFALALAALTISAAPLDSQAFPSGRGSAHFRGHSGWGHGPFWGGIGFGLGIGLGTYYYGAPWYPGYVLTVPAPMVDVGTLPPAPVAMAPPDPIIYPRNGQSASQTEADRQACDRWATTQPSAMADASVFHRATLACMEGRGYTVR